MEISISLSASKAHLTHEAMLAVGNRKGGFKTLKAKRSRLRVLSLNIAELFRLRTYRQLTEAKAQRLFDSLLSNHAIGTVQNYATDFREILSAVGRDDLAKSLGLTNEALGCSGRCRDGTHVALTDDDVSSLVAAASAIDEGVALVLEICFEFGLRPQEGIAAAKSIDSFLKALRAGRNFLDVRFGTKGGRERGCLVLDKERAEKLLERCSNYMATNDGWLISAETRERAISHFYRVVRSVGMTGNKAPHSFRYTFSWRRFDDYLRLGFDEETALMYLSRDLGHGDSRFRWIRQVYLRGHPRLTPARGAGAG